METVQLKYFIYILTVLEYKNRGCIPGLFRISYHLLAYIIELIFLKIAKTIELICTSHPIYRGREVLCN